MSEPDNIVDQPPVNGRGEPTQLGPAGPPPNQTRQLAARPPNGAQRERVATLIAALGDSEHPLHQQAIQDLIAIGDPAVPALGEALNPRRPWLASFRAAEALGQIGDGRATSALLSGLRHPNSNVRWSAVRALAAIGDARAMFDLRRVAREDRTKTTWGESVAGTAQSALDQMQAQNVLFRSAELVKTALACVAMLVALVVAYSILTTLRSDLQQLGKDPVDRAALFAPLTPTPDLLKTPTTEAATAEAATPAASVDAPVVVSTTAALPDATTDITGTVLSVANVRAAPDSQGPGDNKVGSISAGDEIVFIAISPDTKWYRIKLGASHKSNSKIDSVDGSGWVIGRLVSAPAVSVPVEQNALPTPDLAATPTIQP